MEGAPEWRTGPPGRPARGAWGPGPRQQPPGRGGRALSRGRGSARGPRALAGAPVQMREHWRGQAQGAQGRALERGGEGGGRGVGGGHARTEGRERTDGNSCLVCMNRPPSSVRTTHTHPYTHSQTPSPTCVPSIHNDQAEGAAAPATREGGWSHSCAASHARCAPSKPPLLNGSQSPAGAAAPPSPQMSRSVAEAMGAAGAAGAAAGAAWCGEGFLAAGATA